jgi:O-antigen ligase
MFFVGAVFLLQFTIMFARIGRVFMLTYFGALFMFLVTVLLFPDNIPFLIDVGLWFFIICLPVALYYAAIRDKSVFFDLLTKSAYFQWIVGMFYFLFTIYRREPHYDIVFSYLLLVPMILLTNKVLLKKGFGLDLTLILTGLLIILAIGARGTVLALIVFIIFRVLVLQRSIMRISSVSKCLSVLSVISVTWISIDVVMTQIERLLLGLGLSGRSVYLLMERSIFDIVFWTGRMPLFIDTLNAIFDSPLWGYGIAGDRVFLNGTYPHNFFLEVLAQFGVVAGTLLIVGFIAIVILSYMRANENVQKYIIAFLCLGFVPSLVSGSFWISANFWILIAMCLNTLKLKRSGRNSAIHL